VGVEEFRKAAKRILGQHKLAKVGTYYASDNVQLGKPMGPAEIEHCTHQVVTVFQEQDRCIVCSFGKIKE
jgi:hypothetical protein